ncbi:MAG: GGDEF domain-containing protein, partial [Sulfurimonas sp.]|nr:GGDEF domain-containing protein [Sulfurimonas sp.]
LKQIKHKNYVRELLNLQQDMIVVSNGENTIDANSAFLNFFNYKTIEDFHHEHPCVCDMFIKEEGYLAKEMYGLSWIEYMKNNPKEEHRVKILNNSGEERIFEIELEKLENSNKVFILFRDITDDMRLHETLQERANYDALTHIFNRGRFEYYLDKEILRSSRNGEKFSLIMFDIDHFKEINDTYGHDVGDIVLKELTSLVSKHIRNLDVFARWGGEEFMIISLTNIEYSERFAEKLREVIDKNVFTTVGHVCCSFGVTQFHHKDTKKLIVKRCDNMLYSAKEAGRNCVVSLR